MKKGVVIFFSVFLLLFLAPILVLSFLSDDVFIILVFVVGLVYGYIAFFVAGLITMLLEEDILV